MRPLPILNVQLSACHEDWQQMTPVAQGHHCAQCNRLVIDFTTSTQAELEATFQNAPDGRVCGRFREEQLAPTPQLRPKLRRFLVALVLVCGLGLSGQQAVAQVRKAEQAADSPQQQPYGYVEQMPTYKGGQEAILKFIAANLHWPDSAPVTISGKVFVRFQITETGAVRDVQVVKGLHPALDAEAVRVVKLFDGKFTPGQQNNRPVPVGYTIPIAFQGTEAPTSPRKHK